ncbi:MAG: glycosyltransferase family 4 protein [Chlamydiae bacterium]|nr:glycosyltransferase family 4 protein [Chlamydiota bacterium]
MAAITLLKSGISHLGGLEKYTLRLAGAFARKGCDVTLLTTGDTKAIDPSSPIKAISHTYQHKLSVLKVSEFDKFCRSSLKKSPTSIIFGLDRNRHQTHIRAGNGAHAAYLFHRKRSEGFFKKVSFSLNPLHRLLLAIEKESFESPDLRTLFTNSHMVKNEILSYYNVEPSKLEVIHNGVEWEEMQGSFDESFTTKKLHENELGLPSDVFHFLFIGHNFERKGLGELLEALSLMKDKDFHLSVIGSDKNSLQYKQNAAELGLSSRVTFFGERKDVLKFYQMADCLVIPSHYDPFANVTIEALAMGLTVISSKYNGASEILTKESGHIIEELFDPYSILSCLENALITPKGHLSAGIIRQSIRNLDFPNQLGKMVDKTLETA